MNLNSVVDEMGKLLPRLIGEDIELIVRASGDLGTIRADASQMEQIIMDFKDVQEFMAELKNLLKDRAKK